MSERVSFSTDEGPGIWLFLMVLLAVWVGFILTCDAQEKPKEEQKVDTVAEQSVCNLALEKWDGAQLVQLNIQPETLQAQAAYLKKGEGDNAMLFILVRPACQAPWRAVKAIPLVMKPKVECKDSETTRCL